MKISTVLSAIVLVMAGAVAGYGYASWRSLPVQTTLELPVGQAPTASASIAVGDAGTPANAHVAVAEERAHGLILVGTMQSAAASQSRAWLLSPGQSAAQSFRAGDHLPNALILRSIRRDAVVLADAGGDFMLQRTGGTADRAENCPPTSVTTGAAPTAPPRFGASGDAKPFTPRAASKYASKSTNSYTRKKSTHPHFSVSSGTAEETGDLEIPDQATDGQE